MRQRVKRLPLVSAAALAIFAATSAQAQDTPDAGLEEIVVTAQKRTESLQDTPIAISAITGDAIEKLGRDDVAAIALSTPALAYGEAGGEAQVYLRGVGSNLFTVGADPSVAINLDGVYLGRANMGLTQFLDVDRVEVLRGPQGTLYGRNATGGAINILSRMPTNDFEGYGSLGFGSFERRELKAAVSGPLSDKWSARVAIRGVQDDGFTDDLDARGGEKIDDNDMRAIRAIARYNHQRFGATLIGDYSEFEGGNTSIRPIDNLGAARVLGALPTDFGDTRNNVPSFFNWQTGGVTATFEWQTTDNITVTSVNAYRAWDSDFLFNTDGTEIEVTRTTQVYDTKQWSSELRVNGDYERLHWIGGLYYLDEEKFGALGLVRVNLATPGAFLIPATNDGQAWAAFGQADFDVTDRLTVTAGLRYSDEEKDDFNQQINIFQSAVNPREQILLGLFGNLTPVGFVANPMNTRQETRSWDAWTPKVGVTFRAADDVLLFASYTKGFKSGGFNDFQPTNPAYDPEFIKSYEIGAKSEWLDKRLRLNGSIYYYDYTDLQVSGFINSLTAVTNAAAATIQGAEIEASWRPVDAFRLDASLGYIDATYDSFRAIYGICSPLAISSGDASCPVGTAPGSPRFVQAGGNRLNNAPEFKGNLGATYDLKLSGGSTITFFGQVSYQDEIFFNAANDPVAAQDAVTLLDARVSFTTADGALEVSLSGKNLSDEDYFHNIVQFTSTSLPPPAAAAPAPGAVITDPLSIGHSLGYPAAGRQIGVELTYRFGN
jgi:iron complex outermembrane receptor protein